jgi:hypothetical protein
MSEKCLKISEDFYHDPFGRYPSDGEFSGEHFRKDYLIPALNNHDVVVVDLDGLPDDVGSSFFEEIFGGLVREGKDGLLSKLKIKSSSTFLKSSINRYIDKAIDDRN